MLEVVTRAVMHLLVDCLMSFHCSDSCKRVDRGILYSRRVFDSCGGCVDSYLVGRDNLDQIYTLTKAVDLSLDVVVNVFILKRS